MVAAWPYAKIRQTKKRKPLGATSPFAWVEESSDESY